MLTPQVRVQARARARVGGRARARAAREGRESARVGGGWVDFSVAHLPFAPFTRAQAAGGGRGPMPVKVGEPKVAFRGLAVLIRAAARRAREANGAPSTDVPVPFHTARTDPLKCAESIPYKPTMMVHFNAAILRRTEPLLKAPP